MAGPSDRPMMLYHETHQSKLRVLHCINAVLQGPFFSDQDLIDLASSFSKTDPALPSFDDDFDFSHVISLGGPFSLKVLKAALEVWGLQIVPMEPAVDLENAFVCHSLPLGQWVCVRRVGGEWYSFDGAHDVPERLPRSGLAAHFNHLQGDGWGVSAVRGNLPDECPVSSSRYGKWVPPEDAQGAKKAGPSNRPMMLYHETHQSKLRLLHCINTVLQGPFFSDQGLTDLASSFSKTDPTLDDPILPSSASLFNDDEDDDMDFSLGGPFSLKVLKAALEVWGLQTVPMEQEIGLENAFVCHSQDLWVCLRRVGGEWYSFDGTNDVPERLPKHALSAYFDALRGHGWGVFAVRGDLPDECPASSIQYGKWVPPEDAQGAKKSPVEIMHAEEEDLKAAIAASLRDFKLRVVGEPTEAEQKSIMHAEEEVLKAAMAASMWDSVLELISKIIKIRCTSKNN